MIKHPGPFIDVNQAVSDGSTPLLIAAGLLDPIEFHKLLAWLLDRGVDIKAKTWMETPFYIYQFYCSLHNGSLSTRVTIGHMPKTV